MTEKTFAELFPEVDEVVKIRYHQYGISTIYYTDLMKHCLSKQRVREAWSKVKKRLNDFDEAIHAEYSNGCCDGRDAAFDFEKELELEK